MISKKEDNTLLIVAVIAVVVAAIGLFVTWGNIFALEKVMLGPSGTGLTNVSISSTLEINFTVTKVDWGAGSIPLTCGPSCIDFLDTNSTFSPDRSSLGYWGRAPNFPSANDGGDNRDGGFVVENIGNSPVKFAVASIDAATYIPVTGTGSPTPMYAFTMHNNKSNSCTAQVGGTFDLGWVNFTGTTLPGNYINVCDSFSNNPSSNALEINVRIGIPVNAQSGTRTTSVTGLASL